MTSNSQLMRKNERLRSDNDELLELRISLLNDNRRLDGIIAELQTHLDLQEQALADMTEQRDEARTWAWRFYKALDDISLIALDYDGYRSAPGLMGLIDELRHIAGKAITGK